MPFERLERVWRAASVRLATWYAAFFIIGSALLFALAYVLVAASLADHDRQGIWIEAHELANHYQAGGLKGVRKAVAAIVPGSLFVRVADPANVTVFLDRADQWAKFNPVRLDRNPLAPDDRLLALRSRDDKDTLEVATLRLPDGFVLQVGRASAQREATLSSFRSTVAAVLGIVVLLGGLGGAILAVRALRPIRQLIRTVRQIEAGAMGARVPLRHTGDELDELGQLFNSMLDKIAALIQGMRGALDAVAHDLRTPLTRLRGTAEVALRSEQLPDAWREALADCVDESDQLLTMVNTLMDISEAETGALRLRLESIHLPRLVADTIDVYQHVADEKAITLSANTADDLWLSADQARLRQVLANLVDNAIKYTDLGGRVQVEARREGSAIVIRVRDTGRGIAPDELPRVWDRLYRGADGRSSRGLGLGLSLVKAVVEAHGGQVAASSAVGVGSVLSVYIPAVASHAR